ncbi:spore Coat Protein U domain protein [Yersinia pestis Angola]|nr:spore Coat Protein U domain protein [Yersinia pestis Angola]
MRKTLFTLSVIAILQTAPHITYAAATTGTLSSTLTIISGCYINDGTGSGSLSNLGTINFGSVVALSSVINVAFSGTLSGTLSLYCSANTAYTIAIDNGLYSTSGQRRLRGGPQHQPPLSMLIIICSKTVVTISHGTQPRRRVFKVVPAPGLPRLFL